MPPYFRMWTSSRAIWRAEDSALPSRLMSLALALMGERHTVKSDSASVKPRFWPMSRA